MYKEMCIELNVFPALFVNVCFGLAFCSWKYPYITFTLSEYVECNTGTELSVFPASSEDLWGN